MQDSTMQDSTMKKQPEFEARLDVLREEVIPGFYNITSRLICLAERVGCSFPPVPVADHLEQPMEPNHLGRLNQSIGKLREQGETMAGILDQLETLA